MTIARYLLLNLKLSQIRRLPKDNNGGETNNSNMVANNGNIEKTALRGLLNDLEIFPEYLDPQKSNGSVFFWFGSTGTITPIHHDSLNLIGWWHTVKSLDISISMSFTNFIFPNQYEWILPELI